MDGLPAGQQVQDTATNEMFYKMGFPLGHVGSDGNPSLFNHFDITVQYNKDIATDNYRVVGVVVDPRSIGIRDDKSLCEGTGVLALETNKDNEVLFTYSVIFEVGFKSAF